MLDLKAKFAEILLKACQWTQQQESLILEKGNVLTNTQLKYAQKIGIHHPRRTKILLVDIIPQPDDPLLRIACIQTNFLGPNTAGLTLNYGIYIRRDCGNNIKLLCHELKHVAQSGY